MKKLRRILLIDDDEVTCYLNKILLEGMLVAEQIDIVHDGIKGLAYIHQHCLEGTIEQQTAPDLIFLDYNMPFFDGFEFLDALEDLEDVDRSRLHIVMLTISDDVKENNRAAKFKGTLHSYITKPLNAFRVEQVLSTITGF